MANQSEEQTWIAGLIILILAEAAAIERSLDDAVPNADEARQPTEKLRAFMRKLAAHEPARIISKQQGRRYQMNEDLLTAVPA